MTQVQNFTVSDEPKKPERTPPERFKLTARFVDSLVPQDRHFERWDAQVTGLLVRVQKTGRKTYYYSYRTKSGRRNRVKIGTHPLPRPTVKAQAEIYAGQVAKGLDPAAIIRSQQQYLQRKQAYRSTMS